MFLANGSHALLIVAAAIGVYTIVGSGLLLLGTHVTRSTLRVLKAIEASGRRRETSPS